MTFERPASIGTKIDPSNAPANFTASLARRNTTKLVLVATVLVMAAAARMLPAEEPDRQRTSSPEKKKESDSAKEKQKDETATDAKENDADELKSPFPQQLKLPQNILDGGAEWLNAGGPISVRDLKGKIVIVDFWTYCCINCMHVLPELKYIEEKFPNEVVVIGCHSAKFENEKETENIRRAIMRYEIKHPVVNDAEMVIWRRFGTRSWPTLAFIDPEGYYLGSAPGEVPRETLEEIVGKLVTYHRAKGTLDETPVQFEQESAKLKPSPLRFPGKLLADEPGNRLFIADSNHNRIVISDLDGELIDVVGDGTAGRKDGSYTEAQFDHPHGMALVGNTLYIADTENHLLRTIDLEQKTVSTLAGTGKQARTRDVNGDLHKTPLNSPWALVEVDGTLYIAMAGPHQIWQHKIGSAKISVFAGSGREDIIDGPLDEAAFAQPSGIVTDGKFLYLTDSEGSSIRRVPTDPAGEVSTVVGSSELPSARLFTFGDVDGPSKDVLLQHPIGIAIHGGQLYITDTYNHKVKTIELGENAGTTTTFLGDGEPGDRLDPLRLSEPEGLVVAAGRLYIADTNNHRIVTAELDTGKVAAFEVQGLTPPEPAAATKTDAGTVKAKPAVPVELQSVVSGESLRIKVGLTFPESYKLNKLAPVTYKLSNQSEPGLISADEIDARKKATVDGDTVDITIPLSKASGKTSFDLALTYVYCRDGTGGLCKLKTARWRIPVEVSADGKEKQITLQTETVN